MQYRTFGKLDWAVSALGFGCMRLPTLGSHEEINEPEAIRMLHHAIDQGVNHIDTAYAYHGGRSEVVVGRALKAGNYRERVHLATKLPCWEVKSAEDFDRLLNEQLGKLQTDHIGFYLLHALNKDQWPKMRDLDVLDWADKATASAFATWAFRFATTMMPFRKSWMPPINGPFARFSTTIWTLKTRLAPAA